MKNADKLEEAFLNAGAGVKGLPFIASLRSFNQGLEQCFGVKLKDGYMKSIRVFVMK